MFIERRIQKLSILIMVLLVAVCSCTKERTEGDEDKKSASMTASSDNILLRRSDGAMVRLASFRGRIVLLNFIATWNNKSREIIPIMNALQRKFKANNVDVIALTLDDVGASAANNYIKKNAVDFPLFLNGEQVAGLYGGVGKLPTTIILLRDGSVHRRIEGLRSERHYREKIVQLLSHRM
jgi:thiol-disulfide isomerase/thioredoxin